MAPLRSARSRRLREPLSERAIASVLRQVFPRRLNFSPVKYNELLDEALQFGVKTRGQYQTLMKRHRRAALAIDKAPLDTMNERIYRNELGNAAFADAMRLHQWFHWEGLARLVFELEFGDAYEQYVLERYRDDSAVQSNKSLERSCDR